MLGDRRYVAARTSLQCCGIGDMSGLVIAETRVPCPLTFIAIAISMPETEPLAYGVPNAKASKVLQCDGINDVSGFCGPKVLMLLVRVSNSRRSVPCYHV